MAWLVLTGPKFVQSCNREVRLTDTIEPLPPPFGQPDRKKPVFITSLSRFGNVRIKKHFRKIRFGTIIGPFSKGVNKYILFVFKVALGGVIQGHE